MQIPSQFHKSRIANVILCFSVFVAFDWVKKSIKFAVCVTLHHSKKERKRFLILCVREQVWKPVNRWIENFYNNELAAAARKCLGSQCNNFSPSTTSRPPPLTNVQLPRRTKTTTTNTVLPLINHPLIIICRVVNIYPTGNERTNENIWHTY